MRTVTETYEVYTYPELSKEARDKVNQWYLDDDTRTYEFGRMLQDDLEDFFPNSDLRAQFDISCCQGDGLNFYGTLDCEDLFRVINDTTNSSFINKHLKDFKGYLTEKEQRTVKFYSEVCGDISAPYNHMGSYCIADNIELFEDWTSELEYRQYHDIKEDLIRKTEKLVIGIFNTLSGIYYTWGYKYFYEPDEDEIAECCEANEWEFLKDGTFYG